MLALGTELKKNIPRKAIAGEIRSSENNSKVNLLVYWAKYETYRSSNPAVKTPAQAFTEHARNNERQAVPQDATYAPSNSGIWWKGLDKNMHN